MKKLYSLFLLLTGLLCFTSCGDDDYTYTAPETLNVTKADLYFTSSGGTGNVEIKSNSGLRATSSVDWCTVSVSGGVITATVVENVSLESRAGTITVNDGTLSSLVAVYQEGLACNVDMSAFKTVNPNTESSTSITIDSSSPYAINIPSYATSWLSYTDEAGEVTFNLTANETEVPRAANVIITSGERKVTLVIAQYEFTGTWTADFLNSRGVATTEQVEIADLGGDKFELMFKAPYANAPSPVFQCTYANGAYKIANGAAMGQYAVYYLFGIFSSEDGYFSWDTSCTYSSSFDVAENGTLSIPFGDDGSWPGKVTIGMGVVAFTSSTPSSSTAAAYYAVYDNLVLHK